MSRERTTRFDMAAPQIDLPAEARARALKDAHARHDSALQAFQALKAEHSRALQELRTETSAEKLLAIRRNLDEIPIRLTCSELACAEAELAAATLEREHLGTFEVMAAREAICAKEDELRKVMAELDMLRREQGVRQSEIADLTNRYSRLQDRVSSLRSQVRDASSGTQVRSKLAWVSGSGTLG